MILTIVIDTTNGILSGSDRAAVERAINLIDGQRDASVAVCCPSGDPQAIRFALAAGASHVVSLSDLSSGLVLFGIGGTGIGGDLLPAKIASKQSAELILEVLDFQVTNDQVEALRDAGRGEKESLTVALPVVMVMSNKVPTHKYISRFRQQSVRLPAIPSAQSPVADTPLFEMTQWQPLRPRTKTVDLAQKTSGSAQSRMFSTFGLADVKSTGDQADDSSVFTDVDDCVTHLMRYLAHNGFLGPVSEPSSLDAHNPDESQGIWGTTLTRQGSAATPNRAFQRELDHHQQNSPAVTRRPRPYGNSIRPAIRGPFPYTRE